MRLRLRGISRAVWDLMTQDPPPTQGFYKLIVSASAQRRVSSPIKSLVLLRSMQYTRTQDMFTHHAGSGGFCACVYVSSSMVVCAFALDFVASYPHHPLPCHVPAPGLQLVTFELHRLYLVLTALAEPARCCSFWSI